LVVITLELADYQLQVHIVIYQSKE
jgi:hypothetical protein